MGYKKKNKGDKKYAYIRWCSIGTGVGSGMDNNRSIYSVSDSVEQKKKE